MFHRNLQLAEFRTAHTFTYSVTPCASPCLASNVELFANAWDRGSSVGSGDCKAQLGFLKFVTVIGPWTGRRGITDHVLQLGSSQSALAASASGASRASHQGKKRSPERPALALLFLSGSILLIYPLPVSATLASLTLLSRWWLVTKAVRQASASGRSVKSEMPWGTVLQASSTRLDRHETIHECIAK